MEATNTLAAAALHPSSLGWSRFVESVW